MSYYSQSTEKNLASLVGKTVVAISRYPSNDDFLMTLSLSNGTEMAFIHHQDCCESVYLDDVDGDDEDIIGSPILVAEEVFNTPADPRDQYDESFTWTFYRLATAKGYMTIKFYGTSNGFYSESVDFVVVEK